MLIQKRAPDNTNKFEQRKEQDTSKKRYKKMKAITIIENNHVTGIVYGTVEIGTSVKTVPYKKATNKKVSVKKTTKTKQSNIRSNTYQKSKKTANLIPIANAIEIRVLYQIKSPVAKSDAEKRYKKLLKKLNNKRSRKFMFSEDREVINEAMAKSHKLRLQHEEHILKQQQIKYAWEQYQK